MTKYVNVFIVSKGIQQIYIQNGQSMKLRTCGFKQQVLGIMNIVYETYTLLCKVSVLTG